MQKSDREKRPDFLLIPCFLTVFLQEREVSDRSFLFPIIPKIPLHPALPGAVNGLAGHSRTEPLSCCEIDAQNTGLSRPADRGFSKPTHIRVKTAERVLGCVVPPPF